MAFNFRVLSKFSCFSSPTLNIWVGNSFGSIKANAHQTDSQGFTVLHACAIHPNMEDGPAAAKVCAMFVESFDLPVDSRSTNGRTPLHVAACRGSLDCIGQLIELGADIDARANDEGFALAGAAQFGHLGAVRLLI